MSAGEMTLGRALLGAGARAGARGPLAALGPWGWAAIGAMTLYDAYTIYNALDQSDADANTDATTCTDCEEEDCHRTATVSASRYPETASHVADSQASGYPSTLTIDRPGASARRRASLAPYPSRPGFDRDEYPPAMFVEGGAGSSVRYISPADNQGAGASIGNQLRGVPEGCKVTIVVGP